jgi:hypothetical protein
LPDLQTLPASDRTDYLDRLLTHLEGTIVTDASKEFNVSEEAQKETLKNLQDRESAVKENIEKYRLRLLALTDEEDVRRKEMQKAFRAKHEKAFVDVNFKHALIGGKVRHVISVGGIAKYFVSLPTGETENEVGRFVANPKKTDKEGNETDLGPITNSEQVLLSCLTAVQLTQGDKQIPEQVLSGLPIIQRLALIRQLPIATASHLADECMTMQALMNVVLELDMGNS